MTKKDFYAALGVPSTATEEEIKKAYKKLAVQYHPDKNPGDAAAEETFKGISEAYATLSSKEKRSQYDSSVLNFESDRAVRNVAQYGFSWDLPDPSPRLHRSQA